eukprot:TRINITY_DN2554_c0_g1_i2.p1 TRINITY_DN2554_c0_g1~~TRINITY_DN2554_c0_g1_i2.p1  ORF type:complete len:297 (+),score=76.49 TRINITY_DN2554_c0_g1_i2:112-891(+)
MDPPSPLLDAEGRRRAEVVLDLDNCCYPKSSAMGPHLSANITAFGVRKLGLREAEAREMAFRGYKRYGLGVAAYVEECGLDDIAEFMEFVHHEGVDYAALGVLPDPRLVSAVRAYGNVWVFTNGTHTHAHGCLAALGFDPAADFGERVISCYEQWGVGRPPEGAPLPPPEVWANKPHRAAYARAAARIDASLPVVFADDVPKNLEVPHGLGWVTVLVDESYPLDGAAYRHRPPEHPAAHYVVAHVADLFQLPLCLSGQN